jgi:hypothetical protein
MLDLSFRHDSVCTLADWVEISTLFRADGSISCEDLVRSLNQDQSVPLDGSVNQTPGGRLASAIEGKVVEVFDELESRQSAIGTIPARESSFGYPFRVVGDVLELVENPANCSDAALLYLFLLSITRWSMDSRCRRLNGIDPTLVFEKLCADVLRSFWGASFEENEFADVFVIGTSAEAGRRSFTKMITDVCTRLHEGGGWKEGARSPGAGDGGLDLIVWRRFSDERPGNLVGFAQCKTGEHWQMHLGKHNPASICHRFFKSPLVLEPLPIYMVPCRVDLKCWEPSVRQNRGIVFDRCRLTQYGGKLGAEAIKHCRGWFETAVAKERQHFSKRLGIETTSKPKGGKR